MKNITLSFTRVEKQKIPEFNLIKIERVDWNYSPKSSLIWSTYAKQNFNEDLWGAIWKPTFRFLVLKIHSRIKIISKT